ncbi:oxidoreductase, partial [Microbacterium sp. ASV81]|nr:oxidoreductase [Microbacterium sp. ASV81]
MTGSAQGRRLRAAVAGAAAALLGVGAGELAATLLAPASSPFAVVGGALIDAAPRWAKDTAIALFGTGDKAALLTGVAIVLLVLAALLGVAELRWRRSGVVGLIVVGAVVALLAPTRADATTLSWLPALLAGVIAAAMLNYLAGLLRLDAVRAAARPTAAPPPAPAPPPSAAPP